MSSRASWLPLLFLFAALACGPSKKHPVVVEDAGVGTDAGEPPDCPAELESVASDLRINEVVSSNDGVAVDELGETDDFIELYNAGKQPISLGEYRLRDS